jgi:hypothetical protein
MRGFTGRSLDRDRGIILERGSGSYKPVPDKFDIWGQALERMLVPEYTHEGQVQSYKSCPAQFSAFWRSGKHKNIAGPFRTYSVSKQAGFPGSAGTGVRVLPINCLGHSSMQTSGRFSSRF